MTKPETPIRLYQFPGSGHCHRVRVFLSMLGLPAQVIDLDRAAKANRQAEFLAKNPFGLVPVIEDGDVTVADSNAILVYLATRYDESGAWLPRDALGAAQVQRWLTVAASDLAAGPMTLRRIALFGDTSSNPELARKAAQTLCSVLDRHLADRAFLVGAGPTIADLALYAYMAMAPKCGFPLDAWPSVQAWLTRIEALPGFIPI
jgi:glutathione S-transferase